MTKSAMASAAAAQKDKRDAFTAEVNKEAAVGRIQAQVATANRPIRIGGAGGKPSTQTEGTAEYYNYFKEMYPDKTEAQLRKMALDKYLEMKGPGLEGVRTRTEATTEEKARERAAKRSLTDPDLNTALRKKDSAGAAARRAAILDEELKRQPDKPSGGPITPQEFETKWATLKKGETLVGPDGVTYTKK